LSLVRVPIGEFSVARKLSTIDEQHQGSVYFGEEIAGAKATNPKNILISNPGEYVGFRGKFFL
jgi:hypothetical protein